MNNENLEQAYNDFIEECKYSLMDIGNQVTSKHGGKRSLNLIDEVCDATS